MVRRLTGSVVVEDFTPLPIHKRKRVHGSGHGPPGLDLGLDLMNAVGVIRVVDDLTVFGHRGVGVIVESDALAPAVGEGAAGTARIHCGAGRVDVFAEPLRGLRAARQVGLASESSEMLILETDNII